MSMASLHAVKKGDTVFIHTLGERSRDPAKVWEAEVVAAGHKYITVQQYARTIRFDIQTGREVTEYRSRSQAFPSMALLKAKLERDTLLEQARSAVRDARLETLPTSALQELVILLRGSA